MWFVTLIQLLFSKVTTLWEGLLVFVVLAVVLGGLAFFVYKFIISKIKIDKIKAGIIEVDFENSEKEEKEKEKTPEVDKTQTGT